MKFQSSVLKALGVAAAFAVLSGSSFAQAPGCSGTNVTTAFGRGCASRVDVPAITREDYAAIRLQFSPPERTDDVINPNDLQGTWLRGLLARAQGGVRSATVLLEVQAVDRGGATGVPIATVPLAVYEYDGREKLKFRETQEFGDRVIGPRLLIRSDQTIRARIRVVFGAEEAGSLVDDLARFARTAATLSSTQGGFVVHAIANNAAMADLRAIEQRIRSVNEVDGSSDAFVNLSPTGENRLVYDFSLNPQPRRAGLTRTRPQPRPQGHLVVTIERRASMLTDAAFDGAAGQRIPDYGGGDVYTSMSATRVWQAHISPGVTPDSVVQQGLVKTIYEIFQRESTPPATFETTCLDLQAELQRQGAFLSQQDQAALFWAAFVRTPNARRPELRETRCISESLPLWTTYRLPLPAANEAPPPLPTRAQLDEWIDLMVGPAIAQGDSQVRYRLLSRIFASQVLVDIEPNSVIEAEAQPNAGETIAGRELALRLKNMRVGCRFYTPEAQGLPRFSILGRDPSTNRLYTVTVDYRGRRGGASTIEVEGLAIRSTTDSDFALLRAQRPGDARCFAPETAPSALAPPPTPAQSPTPAQPPRQ